MTTETSIFLLPGMDCPVEAKLVAGRLQNIAGIHNVDFNILQRKVKVKHDSGNLDEIAGALAGLNMGATLLEKGAGENVSAPETAIPWRRLGWALALAALSEGCELYGTYAHVQALEWASLAFALAAVWICGLSTYKKGWLALRNLNLNINSLMSVAVTGAILIGQWPEAAMVMVLFNVSEAIESRALLKARDAIGELVALAPHTAEVLEPDGSWRVEHAHDIAIGRIARVRPGEKIPLDGRVRAGESAVNQAAITGESMPVAKKKGDFVYAGTVNGNGALEFEVTADAHDTTLARIIHAVEDAQATRAPMQRLVDVFASWYTPAIFAIGVLCAVAPPLFWGASWFSSIYTGLVMLVIGCPCALVISTPVTIVSGMAAATRNGILIKGGVFLERGRQLRCMAMDKTGTITEGKPEVTDFILTGGLDEKEALTLAASLAARSDHPVSGAILARAAKDAVSPQAASDFEAIPGLGIRGIINGRSATLGSPSMAGQNPEIESRARELEKAGKTVSLLLIEDRVAALFAVSDQIRPGSRQAIKELIELGVTPVMLTGDNSAAANAIAREAGITSVKANLLPNQKLEAIGALEKEFGMTGMVGDGINDAPSLAKANISFAMAREGTDAAIETADVALMDDDLRKVPRFIRLSRSTFAILVENITLALAIKAVFFCLALAGLATMWMAVFADVGAALLVIANGMRALAK